MAKKSSGKHYTSQGLHSNVSRKTLNVMRADRYDGDKTMNIWRAYLKGQNPWVTIDNPNKEETNKRKIRVKANTIWLPPKERSNYIMKSMAGD